MEKQKENKNNSNIEAQSNELLNAIISTQYIEQVNSEEQQRQISKEKKSFLSQSNFSFFSPLKWLWAFYRALSFSIGFVFLTLIVLSITFSILTKPTFTKTSYKSIPSIPIAAQSNQPVYMNQTQTSLQILDILSNSKSPDALSTVDALNKFLDIQKPSNFEATQLNGAKLDYKYVGKESLIFTVKTQSSITVNSPILKPVYSIDFQPNSTTLKQSTSRVEYNLLKNAISEKLKDKALEDFSHMGSFQLGQANIQLRFDPSGDYNSRGTLVLDIKPLQSAFK